jgi:hypothetical protein
MGWKDLLQSTDETIVIPWLGGRTIGLHNRQWKITGDLPNEHGWWEFRINNRTASVIGPAEAVPDLIYGRVCGYLCGDRIIRDEVRSINTNNLLSVSEKVHLIESGLGRFARIIAGYVFRDALVYREQDMPSGSEDLVMQVFLDRKDSLDDIAGVTPALEMAFRLESWHRIEVEKRRAELERQRQEQAERMAIEERHQQIRKQLGDGAGRRALAKIDFYAAAKAALAVSDAEYLDHRDSANRSEKVVTFRLDGRRFECVCDAETLQIVDSGICLTAHDGEKGDSYFTLESLPVVIRQAIRERVLHVYRHIDETFDDEDDY